MVNYPFCYIVFYAHAKAIDATIIGLM